MIMSSSLKYRHTVLPFIAILLVFLIVAVYVIVSTNKNLLLKQAEEHAKDELDLMGTSVREALIKHDYATVEQFMSQWAKEHEAVVEIKALAPNNFVLASYNREAQTIHPFHIQQDIKYKGRYLITLKMVKDLTPVYKSMRRLNQNLLLGSVFFTFFMGLAVWYTQRKTVFIPLEKEIVRRRLAEESLQKAHDELERRINERTAELSKTVDKLNIQISERKGLEERLLHSQKMEAVGQLAGGVAHDFNNILTAIISYGSILRSKVESDTTLKSYVDAILTSAERAAHLTRDLLVFSRKQVLNPVLSELNLIVRKYESLISRTICEDIEFRIELTDEDLPVMADSARIEQVLMNLVTNACSVMSKGGKLIIRTGRVELDNDFKKTHGFGKPGMYALISVIDTGSGMDDKTRKRIFEPFFTTKDVGKGTGLGLAITYGIIKQHNGYIHVYSEVGQGTTFSIYLPLVRKGVKEEETADEPAAVSGTETILLAEDEPSVRTSLRIVMEERGFTVIEAVNGDDAIEKFMENRDKIDFIVLDVVMPGKSGKAVYDAIKMVRPDIKAIFTSGYISSGLSVKEIFEEGLTFISKPVQPDDLIRKIREMLDN